MELTHVKSLLDGLGPGWPEVVSVDRIDETIWILEREDGIVVAAEWLDFPARLVLTTPLGRAEVDRRFVVYEMMLLFNSLWRDNGGARAVLDGFEGELTLVLELTQAQLSPGRMQELLSDWFAIARDWRNFVLAPADALEVPTPQFMMTALRA